MICGIGTDIVEIARFQRFIDDDRCSVVRRLLTGPEQECCAARKDQASCMASRFAAKEAFLKALGTGLRDGISWHDMEVVNDSKGKPELKLSGAAAKHFHDRGLTMIHLSLSHDGGCAVAMVVLERV